MGLETQAEYRACEGQGGTLGPDPASRCTGRSPVRRELQESCWKVTMVLKRNEGMCIHQGLMLD